MVMASVSTFQDHSATPAALVAARRCFSFHTGIVGLVEAGRAVAREGLHLPVPFLGCVVPMSSQVSRHMQ